jgi:hypothetical protein
MAAPEPKPRPEPKWDWQGVGQGRQFALQSGPTVREIIERRTRKRLEA